MSTVAQIGSRDPHIVCVNLPQGQFVDLSLEAAMAWGRLFAAAPDLLAALANLLARWFRCVQCDAPGTRFFTTEGDGPYWLCDSTDADHTMPERYAAETMERPLDDARAAIAKAEGK